ncbi:hypothetical protein AQUCO_02000142v1 [Aquilegia coerulea]|uniref:Uncharacterized protein n=1 Tax=Aquilegia coerulea TaxID=218851 RepID=A0A2G5DG80_AQUCA|nr:hypothetical protein AQUCO_02000142v1 [Aquilegia coerulea]
MLFRTNKNQEIFVLKPLSIYILRDIIAKNIVLQVRSFHHVRSCKHEKSEGFLEMALKALFDKRNVVGHGLVLQTSTTSTIMEPSLHGLLGPLMHRIRYRRPQAAPLSHSPLLAATNMPPSGN